MKISVVIPVLNEGKTIASVVRLAWRDRRVHQVLVIDDGSTDDTVNQATLAGASVLRSSMLGKGASMEDGVRAASGNVLVFLDGDLCGLRDDLIEVLVAPIANSGVEFVKARFSRAAGRVTMLTAKPLLSAFFPEALCFEQPIGGIVAGTRSLFSRLAFENDYGVDVGLLLDTLQLGVEVAEVDIGHLEHDSQPLEKLAEMARQVTRVILQRASLFGRLNTEHLRDVEESERHNRNTLESSLSRVKGARRVALIDMDGTLVEGRFLDRLGKYARRKDALNAAEAAAHGDPDAAIQSVGAALKGVPQTLFRWTARDIPLVVGAQDFVVGLKRLGFRVGIVSGSFHIATEIVRRRVFADFSIAHLMKFRDGIATGRVSLARPMQMQNGCPRHVCCKSNIALHLAQRFRLSRRDLLAVGDGENDTCLFRSVGRSIAYRPESPFVAASAHHVQPYGPLTEVLYFVA